MPSLRGLIFDLDGTLVNCAAKPPMMCRGAAKMLAAHHDAGVAIGLCSNMREAAARRILQRFDLARFFAFIAGGDTFPVHKPHPGHVLGVMERMGVEASECAMVGDSSNDVQAARGAGIACIGVTHGYGADMEHLGADALIAGFDELETALAGLGFDLG